MNTKEKSETALNIFLILLVIAAVSYIVYNIFRSVKYDKIVLAKVRNGNGAGCSCPGGTGGNPPLVNGATGRTMSAQEQCASIGKCWDGYQCVRCSKGG